MKNIILNNNSKFQLMIYIVLEKLSKRKETQISYRKKENAIQISKIKFEMFNFDILCLFYHTNIFCC